MSPKKVHSVWFHLYKTLEKENYSIVTERRPVVPWGVGGSKERYKGGITRGILDNKKEEGHMKSTS